MPEPMRHWTEGPARFGAGVIAIALGLGGMSYALLTRGGGEIVTPALTVDAPHLTDMESSHASGRSPSESPPQRVGAATESPTVPSATGSLLGSGSTRIDLNTASAAELELLPGIGPALAQRIIEDRHANGAFTSIDALDRVRGIGPRTIERIRPHARVGP